MSGGCFGALLSPRTSSSASVKNFALPGGRYSAIISLLNSNVDTRDVYPRDYLLASNELFVLTLIITWIVSLTVIPEKVINHPLRWMIGGLNPCFGWDFAPANYIAVFMETFQVYLLWRYAWLKAVRAIPLAIRVPLHENPDPIPEPITRRAPTSGPHDAAMGRVTAPKHLQSSLASSSPYRPTRGSCCGSWDRLMDTGRFT